MKLLFTHLPAQSQQTISDTWCEHWSPHLYHLVHRQSGEPTGWFLRHAVSGEKVVIPQPSCVMLQLGVDDEQEMHFLYSAATPDPIVVSEFMFKVKLFVDTEQQLWIGQETQRRCPSHSICPISGCY